MKKLNVAIIFGVIVALFGAVVVVIYGRHVDNKIADGKATVDVLVADQPIAQGTSMSSAVTYVHVAKIPRAYAVTDPITSLASLTKKPATSSGTDSSGFSDVSTVGTAADKVLLGPVAAGEQLTFSMFGAAGTTSVLTPAPGNIAVAVSSDITTGVANYVSPGSHVDMFVTESGLGQNTASITKLFMSDVKVLSTSYGVKLSTGATTGVQSQAGSANTFVAVLDLKPTDAEKVINAEETGKIYFALNTGSAHTTPTGATPLSVLENNK